MEDTEGEGERVLKNPEWVGVLARQSCKEAAILPLELESVSETRFKRIKDSENSFHFKSSQFVWNSKEKRNMVVEFSRVGLNRWQVECNGFYEER